VTEQDPNGLELAGIAAQDQVAGKMAEQMQMHSQTGRVEDRFRYLRADYLTVLGSVTTWEEPSAWDSKQTWPKPLPVEIKQFDDPRRQYELQRRAVLDELGRNHKVGYCAWSRTRADDVIVSIQVH
jgi:hypothetical protein